MEVALGFPGDGLADAPDRLSRAEVARRIKRAASLLSHKLSYCECGLSSADLAIDKKREQADIPMDIRLLRRLHF